MRQTSSHDFRARPRRLVWRLLLLFVVQAAVVLSIAGRQVHVAATGRPVVFQPQPVGSLAMHRGGAVPLRYQFSDIALARLPMPRPPRPGDILWVVLTTQGPGGITVPWRVEQVYNRPPPADMLADPEHERLVLRGTVRAAPEHGGTVVCPPLGGDCRVWLDYGLEQFPVPEAEAARWEDWRRDAPVAVTARVSADGRAVITGLVLGDRVVRRDRLDTLSAAEDSALLAERAAEGEEPEGGEDAPQDPPGELPGATEEGR